MHLRLLGKAWQAPSLGRPKLYTWWSQGHDRLVGLPGGASSHVPASSWVCDYGR